jgi:hypothetical protein
MLARPVTHVARPVLLSAAINAGQPSVARAADTVSEQVANSLQTGSRSVAPTGCSAVYLPDSPRLIGCEPSLSSWLAPTITGTVHRCVVQL